MTSCLAIVPFAWRYESAGGAFVRDLTVDDDKFVVRYPGLWEAAAAGSGGSAPDP